MRDGFSDRSLTTLAIHRLPTSGVGKNVGKWNVGKLFATGIGALKEPGRYGDGDRLFLAVGSGDAASWIVRVQKEGKRRDIGLGSLSKVSLAAARKRAGEVRAQVEVGLNPVAERKRAAGIPTFRAAAAIVYASQRKAWGNYKHDAQWLSTLKAYAFPIIGDLTVDKIGREHLLNVLAPIWLAKHETARRVRQRVGSVLYCAYVKGGRESEAPMRAISKCPCPCLTSLLADRIRPPKGYQE